PITRARTVGGLAGREAPALRPPAEVPHRLGDLAEVRRDRAFQVRDAALTPRPLAGRWQPAEAHQDINRADEPARRQRRLRGRDHALLEALVVVGRHLLD